MKERNGKIRKTEPSLPKKLITKKKKIIIIIKN